MGIIKVLLHLLKIWNSICIPNTWSCIFILYKSKIYFEKIQLKYQSIENMVVDILVKSLPKEKHEHYTMKVVVFFSHIDLKSKLIII